MIRDCGSDASCGVRRRGGQVGRWYVMYDLEGFPLGVAMRIGVMAEEVVE